MIVLSLFDGMSCGQIALNELGIIPLIYYASEIDKFAIDQTQLNFPNTIQLGSVVDVNVSDLQPIDLLIGGSPCQSFSFAGKRKGMATKCEIEITKLEQYMELKNQGFEFEGQSFLFWEYMRILTDIRQYNPNVLFLLENVEMGNKWERVLSEAIGIYGVHINSALVSAQNRKRIYWTNIRTSQKGLFGELHSDIPQPEDKGILLRDILEKDVNEKYYLSDKMLNYFDKRAANFNNGKINIRKKTDKATTITASCKSVDISDNFVIDTNGRIDSEKTGPITARYGKGADNYSSAPFIIDKKLNPKPNQLKASCFTAGGNSGGNHSDMDLICVAIRGTHAILTDRQEKNIRPLDGKANSFLSTSWEGSQANGMTLIRQYEKEINESIKNDKCTTIDASYYKGFGVRCGKCRQVVETNYRIRRLTPTECARLQTVPDWYKWECSDTQQYRMLGNGWTIEVIKHIFQYLPKSAHDINVVSKQTTQLKQLTYNQ